MNDLTFIQDLYDQGLYSNVIVLCDLFVTHCDNDSSIIENADKKFRLLYLYANALLETNEFERAIVVYRRILLLYKSMKSRSTRSNAERAVSSSTISSPISYAVTNYRYETVDNISILDVKFNLHVCYLRTKQDSLALQTLQSIPTNLRSPRINMALGALYRLNNSKSLAVSAFLEVVKNCPLALEACDELLKLGVPGSEINSIMLQSTSNCAMKSWILVWLKGRAQMYSNEPLAAIVTFQSINTHTMLQSSSSLMTSIALCYNYIGDKKKAYGYFSRVFANDLYWTSGLDTYASLVLDVAPETAETALLTPASATENFRPEHWIAVAHLMFSIKSFAKAIHFLEKALKIYGNRRSFEALLLKGRILMDMKEYQTAATFLTSAMQLDRNRIEPYERLSDCYKALFKNKERRSIAHSCLTAFRNDIRAVLLYYNVYRDNDAKELLKNTCDKMLSDRASGLINENIEQVVLKAALTYSDLSTTKKYSKHVSYVLKQVLLRFPCTEICDIVREIDLNEMNQVMDLS